MSESFRWPCVCNVPVHAAQLCACCAGARRCGSTACRDLMQGKPAPDMAYIVSLRHTMRADSLVTLWRANDRGYTNAIAAAGAYLLPQIEARPNYYNDADRTIAVPCELIEELAVEPPPRWIEYGPAVLLNVPETWQEIIRNRLDARPREQQ